MVWYRFWKTVHGHLNGEKYVHYSNEELKDENFYDEEYFKCEAESWADSIPGGENAGFSYGFEKVKSPPKEWLMKRIKAETMNIEYLKEKIELYKKELKKD